MLNSWVLFVDDNFATSIDTCDVLRENGFNPIAVYCAQAAIEILDGRQHLTALVTDIDLGPGPDGFDIARHARIGHPNLPVVYISGTAWGRQASEGVEGSQFLTKPFHPCEIVDALGRAARLEAA